jgi:tetratricopeptide (TPR) repeat protein
LIAIFAGAIVGLLLWTTLFESRDEASVPAAARPFVEKASVPDQVPAIKPHETARSEPLLLLEARWQPPSATVWPPRETSPTIGVLAILALAIAENKGAIASAMATMDAFPKPMRGDAALAREKNEAGMSALRENSYAMAIARLNEGIQADPADAELRNNLGHALMISGRFDDAKMALIDSITLDPARAAAWVDLARVFARQGDQELAAAAFVVSVAVSKPGENAIAHLTALSQSNEDAAVRMAAAKALESAR